MNRESFFIRAALLYICYLPAVLTKATKLSLFLRKEGREFYKSCALIDLPLGRLSGVSLHQNVYNACKRSAVILTGRAGYIGVKCGMGKGTEQVPYVGKF